MQTTQQTLKTSDQRYIVVDGALWRAANPHLAPEEERILMQELTAARRAVYAAIKAHNSGAERLARAPAHKAKVALGGRRQRRGLAWRCRVAESAAPAS